MAEYFYSITIQPTLGNDKVLFPFTVRGVDTREEGATYYDLYKKSFNRAVRQWQGAYWRINILDEHSFAVLNFVLAPNKLT